MIIDDIRSELFNNCDNEYKVFQSKLIPNVSLDYFIGVRTPKLKEIAKVYSKNPDIDIFLNQLPHDYFDENQIHAFIISEIKDYDTCIDKLNKFMPYIDNWATCDQLSPKVFKKNRDKLILEIKKWIKSKDTYEIRFGIGMLLSHFLDDDFDKSYLKMVSDIKSDEYYINMMIAWYLSTALVKQYDSTIRIIEEKKLDKWVHNKTISKAVESFRISEEQKNYLKTLRIK